MRTICLVLLGLALAAAAMAQNADELTVSRRERLGLPAAWQPKYETLATAQPRPYTDAEAKANALDIVRFEACHVGGQRLLFKVTFGRPAAFNGRTFILYADLDNDRQTGRQDPEHAGVDVMVVVQGANLSVSSHSPAYQAPRTVARGLVVGNVLYVVLDAPLRVDGERVLTEVSLLSEQRGGRGDGTPRKLVSLPRSTVAVPALQGGTESSLRSLDDFRYHDRYVVLEKLGDKGLTAAQVTPKEPIRPGRPRPLPTFAGAREPDRAGSVARQQVPVELLEEAGVARSATAVRCGFPCARGALFDPRRVRLLAGGQEVPCQVAVTAFWPDRSVKWALLDATVPLGAREKRELVVEFGRDVRRGDASSPLRVTDAAGKLLIDTGAVQVTLDRQRFNLFSAVRRQGQPVAASDAAGVRLVDEQGKAFDLAGIAPESLRLEEQGPQQVVVRVEGRYAAADGATYMRYVARLCFRAGSPRVTVALTHVNDHLATEFTDITSLSLGLQPAGDLGGLFLDSADGSAMAAARPFVATWLDDAKTAVSSRGVASPSRPRLPAVVQLRDQARPLTVVGHEFWQRWPKAIRAEDDGLHFDLLPQQPGADYGQGLPHYLLYNLCEGKYRLKWGMSFTTRLTFDFGGQLPPREVWADAEVPVVAVVPASYVAATGAAGPLAARTDQQFAGWDHLVERSLAGYLSERDQDRTYGYLNFGDWYGERGRNWGNNEYDLAHGFFMQFLRTGRREYYRLAMTAARHQADVDCVHAYPDPYYVGANHLHSIGHTGMWSEQGAHATWTWRYGYHTAAASGHVWADGMVDAWCLGGEARVMEAALGLGEHVAWAMSRDFQRLGTHERSAGWSLRAILAIYRQTYDAEYLAAAGRIAAVALREQQFDRGGAWPHVLPGDHAGAHPGGVGNNLFLMGILLGGLQAYHEETQDPAVLRSLQAGVGWVLKSWDGRLCGWPYSALADGTPCHRASTSLNMLIISPVAYVGQITGDQRLMDVVEAALTGVVFGGTDSSGKSIAQKMHFTSGTLALLERWYATHRPDRGRQMLDGGAESMGRYLAQTPDADGHSMRGPETKVFWVRLRAADGQLVAERRPHGSMNKGADTGTIKVLNAAGATVKAGTYSTDGPHEFRCALPGAAGQVYRVEIRDDFRSVWSLRGERLMAVAETTPGLTIGGVGRRRLHFFVPTGTTEFKVKLLGVHTGGYGAVVLAPNGQPVATHQGVNPGQAVLPGVARAAAPGPPPERAELVVRPAAADTGRLWSLVLWAAIDIGCELSGVPPYLALTAESWFDPRG